MKTNTLFIALVFISALLLAGCSSNDVKVGELRSESQSVELGGAESVSVIIKIGAGDLKVSGEAEKLLEADFTYNVAKLKPEVEFTDSTLIVQHPEVRGYRTLQDIMDFRNEWDLRLNGEVPMDLSVEMGAGTNNLNLAGLSLTGLDVSMGAGNSTVNLSGAWERDLDVNIETGAADLTVRLPGDIGVRVEIVAGPTAITAAGLRREGNVYTNDAYGVSEVTLEIHMEAGIGQIHLEEDEHTQAKAALLDLLHEQVKKQGILGMVMAVRLADGTVIWDSAGYTSPSGKERWTADTASLIASVTKTFTAVVVMQLVEEGKLSLDEPVDAWFPEQPDGDKITVRMLLSHTSGLANFSTIFGDDEEKWTREWTPEELIAVANTAGPIGVPGSRVAHYSNTNYMMLGRIIEKVTGNSWEHEVESRIIEPLDLNDTGFVDDGIWNNGDVVSGYMKTSDGYLNLLEHPRYSRVSASSAWAAGGIVSSVSDLMTFASALFDGRLVSKETLELMSQPVGTESDRTWGLGGGVMGIDGYKTFGMGGETTGYQAFFIGTLYDRFIVTALVNTNEGDAVSPSMDALQLYMSQQAESK